MTWSNWGWGIMFLLIFFTIAFWNNQPPQPNPHLQAAKDLIEQIERIE